MSENRFMWNSLDGGDNLYIKDKKAESDKLIHIKLINGKHEFVELMKTINDLEDEIKIGATYEQQYKHILEEFVNYCNEQPRTSRADHLESLLISFLHSKMERYNQK